MAVLRKISIPSTDGIHTLAGVVACPDGEPRGFLQITHGMTEYIGRYERLMLEMAAEGWLCFGHDHLGHGNTAERESELGFIAHRDGWRLLVRDIRAVADAVIGEYGGEGRPYYLLGHSMGSFVARLAAEREVKPDGLIVMGTGGFNAAAGFGIALMKAIRLFLGERHVSPLAQGLAFGGYNKRFGGGSEEDPKPWLTKEESVRRQYYDDPFCNYSFTISAMIDLLYLTKNANRSAWYRGLPHELSVLLVSGAEDPVGNYGRGIVRVRDRLRRRGRTVDCKLYANGRHEILNDDTYEQVKGDILDFMSDDKKDKKQEEKKTEKREA